MKPYIKFNTQKRIEAEKKINDKDGKALYKLMNNAICRKAMENLRNRLNFNKLVYTGMCILEKSNLLIYRFHYDYIQNKYNNKSKLLFADTEILMYEIETEDAYEDFGSNKEMFGFSNHPTKSKYYDNSNKLVIGKMKDGARSVAIEEFVGLKSKTYLFSVDDNSEHKKAKDVIRNVVTTIRYNEYVLLNN